MPFTWFMLGPYACSMPFVCFLAGAAAFGSVYQSQREAYEEWLSRLAS